MLLGWGRPIDKAFLELEGDDETVGHSVVRSAWKLRRRLAHDFAEEVAANVVRILGG